MRVRIAYCVCIFIVCIVYVCIFWPFLTHLLPFHVPWPGKRGKHPNSSNFCAKLQCFQQLGRVSGLPQLKDVEILWGVMSYSKDIQISRTFQNNYCKYWWKMFMLLPPKFPKHGLCLEFTKNLNTISENSPRIKSHCELMPPLGSTSRCHLVQRSHSPPWAKAGNDQHKPLCWIIRLCCSAENKPRKSSSLTSEGLKGNVHY